MSRRHVVLGLSYGLALGFLADRILHTLEHAAHRTPTRRTRGTPSAGSSAATSDGSATTSTPATADSPTKPPETTNERATTP